MTPSPPPSLSPFHPVLNGNTGCISVVYMLHKVTSTITPSDLNHYTKWPQPLHHMTSTLTTKMTQYHQYISSARYLSWHHTDNGPVTNRISYYVLLGNGVCLALLYWCYQQPQLGLNRHHIVSAYWRFGKDIMPFTVHKIYTVAMYMCK